MLKNSIALLAVSSLFLTGCASHEGLIMHHLNTKYLPAVQKDAAEDKKVLEFGKECLSKARTVDEANACNAKVRQMQPDIDIDDFSQWDGKERARVLDIINEALEETNCILNAKDIEEALDKCD